MPPISRRRFLAQAGVAAAATALPPSTFATKELAPWARLAQDPLRPQYHLLPAANWMNDPNGPIFYKGRYHMFFQYNPNGAFWGDMHWAHATSPDMIHWKHEPIAIAPTPDGWDRDGVFSGSAVLDGTTPAVIYTGVLPPATPAEITLDDGHHKWREVQCLATATDSDLRTWNKITAPIIAQPPEGLAVTGFRDPGVWREGDDWLLTLGSGTKEKGGMVLLYTSRDLRTWTYLHPLVVGMPSGKAAANPVDTGDMWECPDFFPLGDRHVLLYAAMGKVFWKTGEYRDRRFMPKKEGVVDFGSYYAAKTQPDASGRRILWGWIPETRPESEYKPAGWAGLMSLPRVLSIGADGGLEMQIAPEAQKLRNHGISVASGTSPGAKQKILSTLRIRNLASSIEAQFAGGSPFALRLVAEDGAPFVQIAYDPALFGRELRVNDISGKLTTTDPISLEFWLDGSSLEVLANRQTALTARIYTVPKTALKLDLQNAENLRSLEAWSVTPISPDRLTR